MMLYAIMYEHLPDSRTGDVKYRLGGMIWDSEQEAKVELRSIRMQNLPYREMWVISFDDPRDTA